MTVCQVVDFQTVAEVLTIFGVYVPLKYRMLKYACHLINVFGWLVGWFRFSILFSLTFSTKAIISRGPVRIIYFIQCTTGGNPN